MTADPSSPPPRARRNSRTDFRIADLVELLIAGYRRGALRAALAAIDPAADLIRARRWTPLPSERTIDRLLVRAREQIEQVAHLSARAELSRALVRLDELYQRATAAGDLRAALAVEAQREKLLRLDTAPPSAPAGAETFEYAEPPGLPDDPDPGK